MTTSIDYLARICHEVNRAYCAALGDHSQPAWEAAPEWQRESARNGVKFHMENPEAGPEGSHENWLKQKAAEGWSYGPVKDPELKTHPCFVPYNQLPQEQRAKDYIFTAVVWAITNPEKAPAQPETSGANLLGLPVKGYRSQQESNIQLVNENKVAEEKILRTIDSLMDNPEIDKRWLAIARTNIEQGFMALNRSIFKPERITI